MSKKVKTLTAENLVFADSIVQQLDDQANFSAAIVAVNLE